MATERETRRASKLLDSNYAAEPKPQFAMDIAAASHRGLVRETNEDHYAVIRRTRSQQILESNVEFQSTQARSDHAYLLMIADGVGGLQFGEVASRLALRTIWELADQLHSWVMKVGDFEKQFDDIRDRVTFAIRRVHHAFEAAAENDPALNNMSTTFTAAYFAGPDVILINLGDSRAYLYRNGRLFQQTRDHTLAQEWIDGGMRPDEVKKVRNVLTKCISLMVSGARPDIHYLVVQPGDVVLLCSDGLSDYVSADTIAACLASQSDSPAIAHQLVDAALAKGGRDNVTVIVTKVQESALSN